MPCLEEVHLVLEEVGRRHGEARRDDLLTLLNGGGPAIGGSALLLLLVGRPVASAHGRRVQALPSPQSSARRAPSALCHCVCVRKDALAL